MVFQKGHKINAGRKQMKGCIRKRINESTAKKISLSLMKKPLTDDSRKKIVEMYTIQLFSTKKISELLGIGIFSVWKFLRKEGIDTSNSCRRKLLFKNGLMKLPPNCFTKNNPPKTAFKNGSTPSNKVFFTDEQEKEIVRLYHKELLSREDIGKKFGISGGVIKRILEKRNAFLSASVRERSFYASGKKIHPNWQGGKSFEPYGPEFNNLFKRKIRKRDNQGCMLGGIHREKLRRALDVHHINYNKLLSIPQNCVSLCQTCHLKANLNREHWTKFFQSLLFKKYGYNYSSKGELIINLGEILEVRNGI